MRREHDHLDQRRAGHDRRGCFDAVHIRHTDVEYQHIGVQVPRKTDCLTTVAGFADDFDAGLCAQHRSQSLAKDRVIVGQHNACLHGAASREFGSAGACACTRRVTRLPSPGILSQTMLPPSPAMRSRTLNKPNPRLFPPDNTSFESKPLPLSSTMMTI